MRITSPLLKDALIGALADEYSRKIVLKTIENAQSVEDLSRSENIPISTAYRRVNELRQVGILTVEKTILTDDGKKFELYRSAFRAVHMDLVQGELEVDVDLNEDVAARLSRLWASMRSA
jgi:predicted transcriptional regulator